MRENGGQKSLFMQEIKKRQHVQKFDNKGYVNTHDLSGQRNGALELTERVK